MIKSIAIACVLATALTGIAQAQDVAVSVGYADLDLTKEAGISRLDRRLDTAIEEACGDALGQKPLSSLMAIRKCSRDAFNDVKGQRQIAIERAHGRQPTVEVANADSAIRLAASRRR